MRHSFILLSLAGLLNACNPQVGPQVTLGPPPSRALKTAELAADATQRLNILSSQTDLSNNSLFSAYRPNAVSNWNGGWTRSLDFTGVSWTKKQAGTAITPRHIVFAAHYILKPGTPLTFHDRSGNVHKRKVIKLISFRGQKAPIEYRSDIAVALLDSPLPPSVKTYRLLPPRTDYDRTLIGSPVIITEQGRRAFINKIRAFQGNNVSFTKNENVPANLYKPLVKGDSGHPSFLLVGGELVLIETHTGGGPGGGPFYSYPALFKALKKAVADLDPRYKIQTVPLNPQLAPALPEKTAIKVQQKPGKRAPAPSSTSSTPTPNSTKPRVPRVRRVPVSEKSS